MSTFEFVVEHGEGLEGLFSEEAAAQAFYRNVWGDKLLKNGEVVQSRELMKEGETVVLLDIDVYLHKACFGRDGLHLHLYQEEDGTKVYSEAQDNEYFNAIVDVFQNQIRQTMSATFATHRRGATKGVGNFRSDLFPGYKANRARNVTNKFVPMLREWAVANGYALEAHGQEADDYLRIWAEEHRSRGEEFCVVSIDKDLKCIPGYHYNPWTNTHLHQTEADAMQLYYRQIMMGDSTDGIKGIPKLGPKTAEKLTAHCKTHEQYRIACIDAYMAAFPGDEWLEQLELNGALIHIKRSYDDVFTTTEWF
jgi:5'-3' exonuclease